MNKNEVDVPFLQLSLQALLHADSLQRTHQVALALQQRAELLVRLVTVLVVNCKCRGRNSLKS